MKVVRTDLVGNMEGDIRRSLSHLDLVYPAAVLSSWNCIPSFSLADLAGSFTFAVLL
jgi:hypothetical protein